MNSSKQIKLGALMSYFTIAFNMIAGLIYTPWMISQIGQNNYGLYTLAASFITLFVMDFGMSAAVTRFVSAYNAAGDQKAVNNLLGIVYKLYLLIDALIFAVLLIASFFLKTIYSNLSPQELEIFSILYLIVGLFSVVSFPFTNLNGILTAYEQFIWLKLIDLFHKIFIIVAMVIALLCGYGVLALVTVNALAGMITIALKLLIIRHETPVSVNFKYRDRHMLKEILGFSVWTTVGSVAQRLIFNITPTIIAAVSVTGAAGCAIFGLSQTIEGYVYTFATAINGMFMPRISKIIYEGKKESELESLMIRIGRIQCMIIGLLVFGFMAFGHSFIVDIWHKPNFSQSYLGAVLLIIPSFFQMPLQIANTTLIVENKVKLQACVLVITGIVNVCLSLLLSKYFGALGACVSIFVAYMLRTALMIVIYHRVLHLNMLKFFKEVFVKLCPWLLITLVSGIVLEQFNPIASRFFRFGVNGAVFMALFMFLVYFFGMNDYEKNLLCGTAKKIKDKLISKR